MLQSTLRLKGGPGEQKSTMSKYIKILKDLYAVHSQVRAGLQCDPQPSRQQAR